MKSKRLTKCLLCSTAIISLLATPITQTVVSADPVQSSSNASSSSSSASSNSNSQAPSNSNSNSSTPQSSSSSQTHTLKNSYVVYSSGAQDKQELNQVLAVGNNFKQLTADANAYKQFIDPNGSTTNAAMISSVAIVPTDPGSGIKVNIKKFNGQNTITKVTAQQYAMVAQMAGVTDVTITVSANRPVSGESALTGVYKALSADGINLNSQNTQSANQMLSATNDAIDANKDDSSYPGKLMAAVGNTTKQINKQKRQGETPTQVQIETTLNQNLKQQNIYNETKNYTTNIVNALVQFNNAPISSSKDYSSHVSDTINNVKNSTGDMMNKAKQFLNSKDGQAAQKQAQSWWNRFLNWLQGLFN